MQSLVDWSGTAEAMPWITAAVAMAVAFASTLRAFLGHRSLTQLRQRHDALRAAVDGLSDGLAYFDAHDRLVAFNRAYANAMQRLTSLPLQGAAFDGLLRAAVHGSAIQLSPAQRDALIERCIESHRHGGKPWLHQTGDGRWLRVKDKPQADGGSVSIFSNVTEFVQLQHELEAAQRATSNAKAQLEDGVESIGEAFALWDADDRLVICNRRYREMFAYAADLMRPGATFESIVRATVLRGAIPEAVGCEEAWIAKRLALHREPAGPVLHPMPDDHWLRVDERRTRDGGYVGVRADVTEMVRSERELQRLNERLAQLSRTDGLTGVANRRQWDDVLQTEWMRAARRGQSLAMVMIDIDHFKRYNDHYGHLDGDACLQRVAQLLQGCTRRAGDLVARYGGEEFALLLPAGDAVAALTMAQRCVEAVQAAQLPHAASATSTWVSISAGAAACLPLPGSPPASLTAQADAALYTAKARGRNQAQAASPAMDESLVTRYNPRLTYARQV